MTLQPQQTAAQHVFADVITPWPPDTQTQVSIIYDLFPSTVEVNGEYREKLRTIFVYAPTPTLYVFSDGPQGPGLLFSAPYDPNLIFGDSKTGFDVYAGVSPANPTIASVVSVRPYANCGCGSKLRGLRPFSTMRHTAAPASAGPLPAPPVNPGPTP